MKRFIHNPILEPIRTSDWESRSVFNAAAIYSEGLVHIVYRAQGKDNVSRLGLATSNDGFTIKERFETPIFSPIHHAERDGCESTSNRYRRPMHYGLYSLSKPRFPNYLPNIFDVDKHQRFHQPKLNWKERTLPFPGIRNKDAVILPGKIDGKYVMFHRIDRICISYSEDLKRWHDFKSIMEPRDKMWDSVKIARQVHPSN